MEMIKKSKQNETEIGRHILAYACPIIYIQHHYLYLVIQVAKPTQKKKKTSIYKVSSFLF